MRYEFSLAVPPQTSEREPVRQECAITHGVISQVRIMYAPEGNGVLHSRVLRGGFQLYPLSPEATILVANPPLEWDEHEEIYDAPFSLILEGWNDDDTFAHTVYLSITLLPQDVVEGGKEDLSFLSKLLRKVFGL